MAKPMHGAGVDRDVSAPDNGDVARGDGELDATSWRHLLDWALASPAR